MISLIDDAVKGMNQNKPSINLPITREQAIELLMNYPQENSDKNHYLMSEAIMKNLAKHFNEDIDYWAMLGLLHDIDWSLTKNNTEQHLTKAPEILKNAGFDENFINIIVSHGYGFDCAGLKDKQRTQKIEHCLAASETLTGIIYAYALMRNKNITNMETKGLKKKFKDKAFSQNCNREIILEIEKTPLSLDEFFNIAINSIKEIKDCIGLN